MNIDPTTATQTPAQTLAQTPALLHWDEDGQARSALWHTDTAQRLPSRVQVVSSIEPANAHRLASAGVGLLWRGDFHAAKQLLAAMNERLEAAEQRRQAQSGTASAPSADAAADFAAHRKAQALRVRVLGQLLIELDGRWHCALKRAPDVRTACAQAWGGAAQAQAQAQADADADAPHAHAGTPRIVPLRSVLGAIGAHEWRKRGVPIAALQGARIHPHHGVFSPVRGEYIDLVAQAPLPAALAQCPQAFDIGVGTGVLSAVLAQRGVPRVVATDCSARALACAADNVQRLGLTERVVLQAAHLFPDAQHGSAALIVCNPPWLPAVAHSALEAAVYDEGSQMLQGFLAGLGPRLCVGGEGWLIMSNLAELLGLREPKALAKWIAQAGLRVLGQHPTQPRHAKASDRTDRLHAARVQEVTTLWRLGKAH